jgi:DNA repair protein SbcC/Rad50
VRPLELTLEGFKSYRGAETFSFEDRMLFGIVGPTGSGKSSILEALIFGLYGKTPRQESATKKLINSQVEQARVRLVFESDGQIWEVIRIIRRKGGAQTLLQRPGVSGTGVTGERQTNDRIVEILGLDFDAFCASVSLPQGEFDRFLNARPSERSAILKGIFRLDRVDQLREAAKGRRNLIDGQLLMLRASLDALPEGPEVLESLKQQHGDAEATVLALNQDLPSAVKAEREIERSADRIGELSSRREQVLGAMARLPDEDVLRALTDDQANATERHLQAEHALRESTVALAAAEDEAAGMQAQTGGHQWVAAGVAALNDRERVLSEIRRDGKIANDLAVEVSRSEDLAGVRRLGLTAREAAASQAQQALQELHRRHSAHLLRLDLTPGQPCPVCEQAVAKVPAAGSVPALDSAEREVKRLDDEAREARVNLESAQRDHDLSAERLRICNDRLGQCRLQAEEAEQRLAGLVGVGIDVAGEVRARRGLLDRAEAAVRSARTSRLKAEEVERAAGKALVELTARLQSHANTLSHASGVLGVTVALGEEGLWGASKRLLEAARTTAQDLVQKVAAVERGVAAATEVIGRFRERFAAHPQEEIRDVAVRVGAEAAGLAARVEEVEAGLARRAEVEGQISELGKQRALFDRLVADFTDAKFTAYLLDEQRRRLSRIAAEKFRELTGHYSFDDEGNFDVVDQRTGLSRTPDTLSGGETFLASLSLALALAEAVAMEGGRLGCFFLDEGFGSLDSASLDLALEGIEALVTPGRVIGLISHVAGMQARLEDLIVLERAADGSTEVVQHEGPIGYGVSII